MPNRLAAGPSGTIVNGAAVAAPLETLPAGPFPSSGRRQGVASMTAAPAAAGDSPLKAGNATPGATPTAAEVASFPLESEQQQVAWGGEDQAVEPADTQVAVGPTDLVEFAGSLGSVWSETGSLTDEFDLYSFFSVPSGYHFSDPRLLYDQISGRWFASGSAVSLTSSGATAGSEVYAAVSSGSDPTGAWNVYVVNSNTDGIYDNEPTLGISSDTVVVSWNDFNSDEAFTGSETWVLQESELLADNSSVSEWGFGPDTALFSVVPAQSLSSTTTEWVAYNESDCSGGTTSVCNTGSPTLGVAAITGTPEAGDVTWTGYGPSIAESFAPPDPDQPGTATTDDLALDPRLLSAVWQDGVLWTSGDDGCTPAGDTQERDCLRLDQVSTTGATPSVLQDFDPAEVGTDLYDPAVTMDGSSDLYVSYTASSSSMYPSAVAADQPLGASADTLDPGVLVESGSSDYTCSGGQTWGYYSSAAPDPSNPSDVWLAVEYAGSPSDCDWGTATAEFTVLSVPPWQQVTSAQASGTMDDALQSVSCVSPSDCWAVGSAGPSGGGDDVSLAEQDSGSGWQVVATPAPTGGEEYQLNGVACNSNGTCWAVGSYTTDSSINSYTLIEEDSGSGWTILPTLDADGSDKSSLWGVTCLGTTDCWAVGKSAGSVLIAQYSGTSWSISPRPSVPGGNLVGVSCVSVDDCWAAGFTSDTNDSGSVPLVEQYTQAGWAVVPSVDPSGDTGDSVGFDSVSCVDSTDCWAVGGTELDAGDAVVEEYNGASWSLATAASLRALLSVECFTSGGCWATGASGDIAVLQGNSWVAAPFPQFLPGAFAGQLAGITCGAADECIAVGMSSDGYDPPPVFQTTFSAPAAPSAVNATPGSKSAVVSWSQPAFTGGEPVTSYTITPYKGSTALTPSTVSGSPPPTWEVVSGLSKATVYDFTVTATNAVGSGAASAASSPVTTAPPAITSVSPDSGPLQGGQSVTITGTGLEPGATVAFGPNPAPVMGTELGASQVTVVVPAGTGTVSVSITDPDGGAATRASAYAYVSPPTITSVSPSSGTSAGGQQVTIDGSGFETGATVEFGPSQATDVQFVSSSQLTVVTPAGPAGAVDVTETNPDGGSFTDRSAYSYVSPPTQGPWTATIPAGSDVLVADTCADRDECWAVGNQANGPGTLILENTGRGWEPVSSPSEGGGATNSLVAVGCAGAADCWAVGDYQTPGGTVHGLIEQFNGSGWSIVGSATEGIDVQDSWFYGVTCASSTECWVVGQYEDSEGYFHPLLGADAGSGWSVSAPSYGNLLSAVTCVSADDCWAVGNSYDGTTFQTLIYGYSGTWTQVAAPDVGGSAVYNTLNAVACGGASECWAVGEFDVTSEYDQSLIEEFSGSSWVVVSSPDAGGADNLEGVACASASDCWAVGNYYLLPTVNTDSQTLTDGLVLGYWETVSSADVSGEDALWGVACDGAVNCWSVGDLYSASTVEGFIEQSVQADLPPTVTSLTPAVGPDAGGQTVTVTGYGFPTDGSMTATLGGVPVTPADVTSTTFTFTTPAAGAGQVYVQATDGYGSSLTDANAAYTYAVQPVVTSVSPSSGTSRGGQLVTIGGSGFAAGATVLFGSSQAPMVQFISSSELTAVTPAAAVGRVGVTVNNPSGLSSTDPSAYAYAGSAPPPTAYAALQPFRICDTRSVAVTGYGTECSGRPIGQGQTLDAQVTGVMGYAGQSVPSDAQSVVLNVTAISGTATTYLTVFPAGSAPPNASNLNVTASINQANLVVVALGVGGQVGIYNSAGTINVAVDIEGYFAPASGASSGPGLFHPIAPLRICDTRLGSGTACSGAPLGQGQWEKVVVSGCPSGDPPAPPRCRPATPPRWRST